MTSVEARPLTVSEAVALIGIPRTTLQRRCNLWERGERDDPRALRCRRRSAAVGRREGDRLIDAADAVRMRDQVNGTLSPLITAEQYARGERGQ